jgi:hypothetical protein
VAWVALSGAFPQTQGISFCLVLLNYMTSGRFLDGIFSYKHSVFLILFLPSDDSYSLLCSSKSSFRGTVVIVNNTGWLICLWCTLKCEYLCEFLKKSEMTLLGESGARGKMIHEKT